MLRVTNYRKDGKKIKVDKLALNLISNSCVFDDNGICGKSMILTIMRLSPWKTGRRTMLLRVQRSRNADLGDVERQKQRRI